MVFPIKRKDEVLQCFKRYEAIVTAKFGSKISRFKCDNGGEYQNKAFEAFCYRKGIQLEFTVPYTPEQNGTNDQSMDRTLDERARVMLEDAKIAKLI